MTIRESRIRLSLASFNFDPAGTDVPPGFLCFLFCVGMLCCNYLYHLTLKRERLCVLLKNRKSYEIVECVAMLSLPWDCRNINERVCHGIQSGGGNSAGEGIGSALCRLETIGDYRTVLESIKLHAWCIFGWSGSFG